MYFEERTRVDKRVFWPQYLFQIYSCHTFSFLEYLPDPITIHKLSYHSRPYTVGLIENTQKEIASQTDYTFVFKNIRISQFD